MLTPESTVRSIATMGITLASVIQGPVPAQCAGPCGSALCAGDLVFMDRLSENSYCDQCGKNLRYHRKKARERGEAVPILFSDVGRSHGT